MVNDQQNQPITHLKWRLPKNVVFWRIWTISVASIGFGYFTRRERNLPHCFHLNVIVEYKLNTAQILHKYMNMSYTVQEGRGWDLYELKKMKCNDCVHCTHCTASHSYWLGMMLMVMIACTPTMHIGWLEVKHLYSLATFQIQKYFEIFVLLLWPNLLKITYSDGFKGPSCQIPMLPIFGESYSHGNGLSCPR